MCVCVCVCVFSKGRLKIGGNETFLMMEHTVGLDNRAEGAREEEKARNMSE